MIPELGHFALALALAVACVQTLAPVIGVARNRTAWMAIAGPAARWQFVLVSIAFASLAYAFAHNDFSLVYVAQNSNSELPLAYRLSAVWGAHEGSLLLWVFILAGWGCAISLRSRDLPTDISSLVLSVMGLIGIAFESFLLFTSNPFLRSWPAPPDGADLNPLLQDPGLIAHPPILYMGYVGFAVPFGFAMAALIRGRLTPAWAGWARPWTLSAWMFLTVGIALGSFWAYYELGWGGWWFWDPVENASFMPWLMGTALVHSLAVSEKRGTFKNWTVLLAIGSFALSLLGTFLVRSGVLTSVHAFATDPTRGIFILAILGLLIGGALVLYAWRAPSTSAGGQYATISRETFLLANSLLLSVATLTVLLGTVYPLVLDAMNLGKISVGPPYFNSVFTVVMTPLVLAMGLGQFARWKQDSLARLWRQVRYFALGAALLGIAGATVLVPEARAKATLGILLALWIAASIVSGIWSRLAGRPSRWQALRALPRSFLAQCLAHLGFAVTLVGVSLTSTQSLDLHTRLAPGGDTHLGPYTIHFDSLREVNGPNYRATEGQFTVSRDGAEVVLLHPQKRFYQARGESLTEAGIAPGLTHDIYISLGEPLDHGAWSVRLHVKAFVRWLWFGALMMAAGGALALFDRRVQRRVAVTTDAGALRPAQ